MSPRRRLHTRSIECRGYEREDGLFDIEASIVDRKTYDVEEPYRGHRPAGAHVHDMELRLTLDRTMTVRDIEVTTNHATTDHATPDHIDERIPSPRTICSTFG